MSIDQAVLKQYISEFLGYGNLSAAIWFVGMEEAGKASDLQTRLEIWTSRGKKKVEKSPEFKRMIGDEKCYFGVRNRISPTLGKLICLELAFYGKNWDCKETVRDYQRDCWGTDESGSAALELSALPEVDCQSWNYGEVTNHELLRSRSAYEAFLGDSRVPYIAGTIKQHKPRHVIMYGRKYQKYWDGIASFGRNSQTIFHKIEHPVSRGSTNERFASLGQHLTRR